jgi:hypothetical protein
LGNNARGPSLARGAVGGSHVHHFPTVRSGKVFTAIAVQMAGMVQADQEVSGKVLLPGLLVLAMASAGCFGCGPSTWQEPGLPAWLNAHGPAGLTHFNASALQAKVGPKLAAALPAGSTLTRADYSDTRNDAILWFHVDPHSVLVEADVFNDGKGYKPALTVMMDFLNHTLGTIHRGPAAERQRAAREFAAAWPSEPRDLHSSPAVGINMTGPWDVEGVFPPGTTFTGDGTSSFVAYAGDGARGIFGDKTTWTFYAEVGTWFHSADDGFLEVSDNGDVQAMGNQTADAQGMARRLLPGYPWTFQAFHAGGSCGLFG